MPLLPIDLQTLFGQATQVGREQNALREGVPQAQAVQGAAMARQAAASSAWSRRAAARRRCAEGPDGTRSATSCS